MCVGGGGERGGGVGGRVIEHSTPYFSLEMFKLFDKHCPKT